MAALSCIPDLPDSLFWLQDKVHGLAKPAAFLVQERDQPAPQGSTFTCGCPDVPVGAAWNHWNQSPYDGPCFFLQLNLEEIPAEIRQPHWPREGVVWLFVDVSEYAHADVYFDPRPASRIPWQKRAASHRDREAPTGVRWLIRATLPGATPETLPEIAHDWRDVDGLCHQYEEWVQQLEDFPSDIQAGGWTWPCQGDFDVRNADFVLVLRNQDFGDSSEISLHYNRERGFYAHVDSH